MPLFAAFPNQFLYVIKAVLSLHIYIRNYYVCAGGALRAWAPRSDVEGAQAGLGECKDFIATAVKEIPKEKANRLFILKNYDTLSQGGPPIRRLEGLLSPDSRGGESIVTDYAGGCDVRHCDGGLGRLISRLTR